MNSKYSKPVTLSALALVIQSLLNPQLALAQQGKPIAGKTIIARGAVNAVDSKSEKQRKLKRRSPIYGVDVVKTGEKSKTQLRMTDGGMIALQENSELLISNYEYNKADQSGSVVMELVKGGLRSVTGAIKSEKGKYELKTPVGSIGIRGTHYEIEIIQGEVFIAVWDGAVDVNVDVGSGTEVSLGEGEDFSYAKIDETGEVTELLEPPQNFNEGHSSDPSTDEEQPEEEQQAEGEGDGQGEGNGQGQGEGDGQGQGEGDGQGQGEGDGQGQGEGDGQGQGEGDGQGQGEGQGQGQGQTDQQGGGDTTPTGGDNTPTDDGGDDTPVTIDDLPGGATPTDPDNTPNDGGATPTGSDQPAGDQSDPFGDDTGTQPPADQTNTDNGDGSGADPNSQIIDQTNEGGELGGINTNVDITQLVAQRTGTWQYSLDTSSANSFVLNSGTASNANVSLSMDFNFDTAIINNGQMSFDENGTEWFAAFNGIINGENIEMYINFASHGNNPAEGIFQNTNFTDGIDGIFSEFRLWEIGNNSVSAAGQFKLRGNLVSDP